MVKILAPAKVNLTLHVTGQREDGYHLLDSLVMFADKGDRVRVELDSKTSLIVDGHKAEGVPEDETNIMVKAARLSGVNVAMKVKKNLPNAAGLGGGSSDAAAVLHAISQLTGAPVPENASCLGADVPVCLMRRTTRMRGIGDRLNAVEGLPALNAVLVNPGRPVPTKEVFDRLKDKANTPMPAQLPSGLDAAELIDWLMTMRNDLEGPAMTAEPIIAQVFNALSVTPGCQFTRMSGSGGTCFGIYFDAETAAAAAGRLKQRFPSWWVMATQLNAN